MKFKRLKIIVAVALIIFIFVVANLIVFGLVENKLRLAATVDDKKNISGNLTIVKNDTSQASNSSQKAGPNTTVAPVTPPPIPVVTQPRVNTRAS